MTGSEGERPKLWSKALGLVSLTLFFGALGSNLLIPASGFIGGLGHDQLEVGLVMGAFNVASLFAMVVVGTLVARLGHARVLVLAGLAIGAGAAVFAVSSDLLGFGLGRAIQGIGLGILLVSSAAYVVEISPPSRMGEALGISGILLLTAQAIAPAIGDSLQREFGWSPVFWIAAVSGGVTALVAIPLPRVAAVRRAGQANLRRTAPVLVATLLAGLGFGAIWTFLGDYARELGGMAVSWFFISYVIAAVASRVFLGSLSDRLGRGQVAAPMLLGHAVAFAVLASASSPLHLITVGVIYGLCHGVYYPTMQAMVIEQAGGTRSTAVAAATAAFGLGIVVAAWGLAPLARAAGYQTLYWVAAGGGVVASWLVWRRR